MQILEWIGASWLPVVAIAVPVGVALYVASQSTRYQMDHRDFERDRAASDAYVERMESVCASQLADGDADQARRALQMISNAAAQWLKASSGSIRLGGYFTEKYVVCARARTKAENGEWGVYDELAVGHGLNQLVEVVIDWPYPERRPATMRKVLVDLARDPDLARSNDVPIGLQVDRWMLTSLPSPYKVVRGWRSVLVWLRLLWHDVTHGSLRERVLRWRIHLGESRAMRKKYGTRRASGFRAS